MFHRLFVVLVEMRGVHVANEELRCPTLMNSVLVEEEGWLKRRYQKLYSELLLLIRLLEHSHHSGVHTLLAFFYDSDHLS